MAEMLFPLEDTEYLAEDVQTLYATRTTGIYGNEHLIVTPAGGMSTSMAKGLAWLHLSDLAGVVYANRDDITFEHDIADASYDRIDRVVIRCDYATNTGYAYIKKGTPSEMPIPPNITRDETAFEISRAQIRIRAGATTIGEADITDESLDEVVCGIASDGMNKIPTAMLHAQAQALIQELQKGIQIVYDGVELASVTEFTGTLTADGWSGNSLYTQTITASGVLGSDKPTVDVDMTNASTAEEMAALNNAWALVLKATATSGGVEFVFSSKPNIDIPVKVRVVR